MGAERRLHGLLLGLLFPVLLCAQGVLQRRVSLESEKLPLGRALDLVAREGAFKLSYNAAAFPVDSLVSLRVEGRTVEEVYRKLLGPRVAIRESGSHVVLVLPTHATVEGTVVDRHTGSPLARTSVLATADRNSVLTDAAGKFRITVPTGGSGGNLLLARAGYADTVVHVEREGTLGTLRMRPRERLEELEVRCLEHRCGVEALGVARLLVPSAQMDQAVNLSVEQRSVIQASLIPNVGTNGELSGRYTNTVSFNLLGGYARGLHGAEFGGGFNMERMDVRGFQFAGGANLVGGQLRGVQWAGAVNHVMGNVTGVQMAGGFNTVWDSLRGVQVAGGVNLVRGHMAGTQVAGGANLAVGDMHGTQVAGGLNFTRHEVLKGQVAGGLNYARHVEGGQVAAGANVVSGVVGGGQVALGLNYARRVDGGQFACGANVVPGPVTGGQVSFGLNYAHAVDGGQFAFGANVVPGKVSGGQVGFGLNMAREVNGGQFALGANFVLGHVAKSQFALGFNAAQQVGGGQVAIGLNLASTTVRGGQFGAVNLARRVEGAQLGLFNFSDTITGTPIGLLSIVRHGYHRVDLAADDVVPAAVVVRTGVRAFYNIFRVAPPLLADRQWAYGYGFGSAPRLGKRTFLAVELTGDQVQGDGEMEADDFQQLRLQLLCRASVAFGVELGEHFTLSAGPHAQLLVHDRSGAAPVSALLPDALLYEQWNGSTHLAGWLGGSVSVGYRF